MELLDMNCCGIFELVEVGYDDVWRDGPEDGQYNVDTGEYEMPERLNRAEALQACRTEIRSMLNGITPRGRLVLATTVRGMGIAEQALRGLRFNRVRRFRNGNSGNHVTLWQKYVR